MINSNFEIGATILLLLTGASVWYFTIEDRDELKRTTFVTDIGRIEASENGYTCENGLLFKTSDGGFFASGETAQVRGSNNLPVACSIEIAPKKDQ